MVGEPAGEEAGGDAYAVLRFVLGGEVGEGWMGCVGKGAYEDYDQVGAVDVRHVEDVAAVGANL